MTRYDITAQEAATLAAEYANMKENYNEIKELIYNSALEGEYYVALDNVDIFPTTALNLRNEGYCLDICHKEDITTIYWHPVREV